jgi:DNA-binding transcriptional MerR regulator
MLWIDTRDKGEKTLLTVKEAAERLSIPPSTIRYYDDQGLFPFVERDENGYRLFKEDEVFWIELIQCMRSMGMSVKTLRHVAHLHMQGEETLDERVQIFEEHQEKLQNRKKEIDAAMGELETMIKTLESQ